MIINESFADCFTIFRGHTLLTDDVRVCNGKVNYSQYCQVVKLSSCQVVKLSSSNNIQLSSSPPQMRRSTLPRWSSKTESQMQNRISDSLKNDKQTFPDGQAALLAPPPTAPQPTSHCPLLSFKVKRYF